ncbi:glutamate-cysteine ligase family protein [Agrobacterium rosae]|uniref:Glutamate--cysteine ligase n=1 Tax=Agrobacterium rosae TaxID=1972867 RepID=A0A1R3U947_9HYPH|nr:glutamate-cysteine ligase family protein [Agrobacterium rosae]SCX35130.1 hypothetical protein DSM25559_4815 [Agrobacterium rosae]
MTTFFKDHADKFKFGWEAELMITDNNFNPLFGDTMPFGVLRDTLSAMPVPDIDYLLEKYVGSGLRPYYIEGYDADYYEDRTTRLDVKGVEIRTPITFSIEDSVRSFETLYKDLQKRLRLLDLEVCCFGNHPFQKAYIGARGHRDIIGWASAEVAMTTQGLAINISLPDALEVDLDREALNLRFSYAAPVMVLLAANTPFRKGELWRPSGRQAYSDRSYRRTFVRNTIYYRDDQHHRKEITLFDMTNDLAMHVAYAALSLGIVLSKEPVPVVPDRFSKENVRQAALLGYDAVFIDRHFDVSAPQDVASRVLTLAGVALEHHGFGAHYLAPLWRLVEAREVQAQNTLDAFHELGSIQGVLRSRANLLTSAVEVFMSA